jgi:hypothetical protein
MIGELRSLPRTAAQGTDADTDLRDMLEDPSSTPVVRLSIYAVVLCMHELGAGRCRLIPGLLGL